MATITELNLGLKDDGDPPQIYFAKVNHEFVEGHHVFTSESIKGLLIAEKDAKKALSQIIPTIKKLIHLQTKQKVEVFLGTDFKEFEKNYCSENPVAKPTAPIKDTIVVIQRQKVAA